MRSRQSARTRLTKRVSDTVDELLKLRTELRKRYRVRQTAAGPVRQQTKSVPPVRGENRKSTVRRLKKVNAHLAEYRWFHRLVTMTTKLYLATGRIDGRLAIMAACCKAAHEAKYPGWAVTAPPPRLPESMSAQGVGSMILAAVRSGRPVVLPPGPLVDRLNAGMIRNPLTPNEHAIARAAKQRVKARLASRARAAAAAKATTTKRGTMRRERTKQLRSKGLMEWQIAEQLGISERQVRRYLTGQ